MSTNAFHLHLVSDSTGETLELISRAALAQFEGAPPTLHTWNMVQGGEAMGDVVTGIRRNPGFVMFTIMDNGQRRELENECRKMKLPCVAALDPVMRALSAYLGVEMQHRPGRQHVLDSSYFNRMSAMDFALSHDDGHMVEDLADADVIIFGVSRTSKTPTCIYLAHRGLRAASVPVVPGIPLPEEALQNPDGGAGPLRVGLVRDARQLVQIRKSRLSMQGEAESTDYVDPATVAGEIAEAKKLFSAHGWPVINITRRSVEETAGQIVQLYHRRLEP